MRLNRYIAQATGLSRREADQQIVAGVVFVNGAKAHLGEVIDSNTDIVKLAGQIVKLPDSPTILLLNKPLGYICSKNGQSSNAKIIYQLLPSNLRQLKTVGRLDKDSSGLILLTDDGVFAHHMTHPKFAKTKRYLVTIDHSLSLPHQQIVNGPGVQLIDGLSHLALTALNSERTKFVVVMTQGRNRQIRRTFAALGYLVKKLHRTDFGQYQLGHLAEGEWRPVVEVVKDNQQKHP